MTYKNKDTQDREHSLHLSFSLGKGYEPRVGDLLVPRESKDWHSAMPDGHASTVMCVTDINEHGEAVVLVGHNLWVVRFNPDAQFNGLHFEVFDGTYSYPIDCAAWHVYRDLPLHEGGPT